MRVFVDDGTLAKPSLTIEILGYLIGSERYQHECPHYCHFSHCTLKKENEPENERTAHHDIPLKYRKSKSDWKKGITQMASVASMPPVVARWTAMLGSISAAYKK